MPLGHTIHNSDPLKKPKTYGTPLNGAERIDQMYDVSSTIPTNLVIDTEKETYAIVYRPHSKGQFALEMTKKIEDIEFVDGVGQITHRFGGPVRVEVVGQNADSITEPTNGVFEINLDTSVDGIFTVILG